MNHFDYRNGVLHAEAVNLIEMADAVGTPFYCYFDRDAGASLPGVQRSFADEKALVCYAMKANSNSRCCARWRNSGPARTWFRAAS